MYLIKTVYFQYIIIKNNDKIKENDVMFFIFSYLIYA